MDICFLRHVVSNTPALGDVRPFSGETLLTAEVIQKSHKVRLTYHRLIASFVKKDKKERMSPLMAQSNKRNKSIR
jgi:hypothetical protein